jgi:hypothetical protein
MPEPPADFAERVMDRVRQNARIHCWSKLQHSKFPFRRIASGVLAACCLLVLGAMLFFHAGFSERQNSISMPDRTSTEGTDLESPNGVEVFTSRSDWGPDAGTPPLYHAKMELVRLLEQTLEIIERGEQEWEVEI